MRTSTANAIKTLLRMDPTVMARIEQATGFDDWTNPQLSAIYWAVRGNCRDVVNQAAVLYRKLSASD